MSELVATPTDDTFHKKKISARGVARTAHIITGHEKADLNRVFYFLFLCVFLASKGSSNWELI